jgi:drug/metabolite transporter (DMT)-like permease
MAFRARIADVGAMSGKQIEGARLGPGVARVHGQMILARALIAVSFPVGVAITHGLEPELLILARFALATLLFAPYVVWRHGLALPTPKALLGYAAISACLVIFFWCMFEALRHTSALNAGAIFTLVPGLSALYAWVLVRERLGRHRLVALGCGLAGALWVVFRGDPERLLALDLNRGDLIFAAGSLALALNMPLVRRLHRDEPTAVMTFWVLAMSTLWLVLLNNAAIWQTDWAAVDGSVYAGIAYLAVFTTIVTFFIQQHATLNIGPTRVTSYSYLNPALVVLVEWLAGHGLPSPITLPGVIIILAATVVLQSGARDERTDAR